VCVCDWVRMDRPMDGVGVDDCEEKTVGDGEEKRGREMCVCMQSVVGGITAHASEASYPHPLGLQFLLINDPPRYRAAGGTASSARL
jgi:hypothetical protein